MSRFSACVAVVAMLFALVAAPLFHVHERDHDGHDGPVVHAHLPEAEHARHDGEEIEPPHSDDHGRSIDLFAVNTPASTVYYFVAEFSQPITIVAPLLTRTVMSLQTVRAHSPPKFSELPPRSPPSL